MAKRPLSDKMKRVLLALLELEERHDDYHGETANAIGHHCGYQAGMARSGNHGTGNVARTMGVAVHVTTALTALDDRGLVQLGSRRDELSGSAHRLTPEGRAEAEAARAAGLDTNAARAEGKTSRY